MTLRAAKDVRYDAVSLGEVMLRFDPGEGRIHTARTFRVWEGGGEYNVVRGLRRCFGLRAAIVTALVDNAVGRLVEDLMLQGGVDLAHVRWLPCDGAGRSLRNGLNFVERGFGARAALGCSDRGHTAISQLTPGTLDWPALFGAARWFHTGGVFAALSESTAEVAREAASAAQRCGTRVSYDLNYRDSLWRSAGGKARAQQVNRAIVPHVDVLYRARPHGMVACGTMLGQLASTVPGIFPCSALGGAKYLRMLRGPFPGLSPTRPNPALIAAGASTAAGGRAVTCRNVSTATRSPAPRSQRALRRAGRSSQLLAAARAGTRCPEPQACVLASRVQFSGPCPTRTRPLCSRRWPSFLLPP